MKLTNIAIHALNACLVLGLLRTLLALAAPAVDARRREWTARFAAAARALQPINLMAVLFVVQRMESLCHMFVFAGCGCTCSAAAATRRRTRRRLADRRRHRRRHRARRAVARNRRCCCRCTRPASRRSRSVRAMRAAAAIDRFWRSSPSCWCCRRSSAWRGCCRRCCSPAAWPTVTSPSANACSPKAGWCSITCAGRCSRRCARSPHYHDDIAISARPAAANVHRVRPRRAGGCWRPSRRWRARGARCSRSASPVLCAQLLTATIVPLELVFEHRNYFASLGVCSGRGRPAAARAAATARRIGALLSPCCGCRGSA